MAVGDIIGRDRVEVGLRIPDKARLLDALAARAAGALGLDRRTIFEALQARENLGSTGLGKGFALPHARLEPLREPFATFVRLARPIDFAAIDEKPVDLVMLLLSPATGGNQHLAMLAALARPLREAEFVKKLRCAPDAAAVHRVLSGT
jgi:PTS system nitrogen regulatory IIA component